MRDWRLITAIIESGTLPPILARKDEAERFVASARRKMKVAMKTGDEKHETLTGFVPPTTGPKPTLVRALFVATSDLVGVIAEDWGKSKGDEDGS